MVAERRLLVEQDNVMLAYQLGYALQYASMAADDHGQDGGARALAGAVVEPAMGFCKRWSLA